MGDRNISRSTANFIRENQNDETGLTVPGYMAVREQPAVRARFDNIVNRDANGEQSRTAAQSSSSELARMITASFTDEQIASLNNAQRNNPNFRPMTPEQIAGYRQQLANISEATGLNNDKIRSALMQVTRDGVSRAQDSEQVTVPATDEMSQAGPPRSGNAAMAAALAVAGLEPGSLNLGTLTESSPVGKLPSSLSGGQGSDLIAVGVVPAGSTRGVS